MPAFPKANMCVMRRRSSTLLPFIFLLATTGRAQVTVFEGARLIPGDGGVIENSAFLVEDTRFTQVGRRGSLRIPSGPVRVDLTGKTVMPAKVDLHGHIGFQHD